MNLIEQLGGYRMAKEVMDSIPKDGRSYTITRDDTGIIFNTSELHNALLEHRRQHNIFEVGDKVVLKRPDQFSEIYTYDAYSEKLDLHFFESENDYGHITLDRMRHATPEEIQAGHRL